jgi:RimJ/RimL family protein N-acetyltransferase
MKDGRTALVRPVRLEDAPALHDCHLEVAAAGVGMTRLLPDCRKTPEEIEAQAREFVDLFEKRGGCALVAEVEGHLAGSGLIRRPARSRLQHTGHIGIGISPRFQGLGLGRAIMEGLIAWARSLGPRIVTRIDLDVFADNTKAIRLYESLGFVVEGRRRRAIRYEDRREIDDLMMALLLD